MTKFNEIMLKQGGIVLAIALVAFSLIIMFIEAALGKVVWVSFIAPVAMAIYGCVALVKRHWPENKY